MVASQGIGGQGHTQAGRCVAGGAVSHADATGARGHGRVARGQHVHHAWASWWRGLDRDHQSLRQITDRHRGAGVVGHGAQAMRAGAQGLRQGDGEGPCGGVGGGRWSHGLAQRIDAIVVQIFKQLDRGPRSHDAIDHEVGVAVDHRVVFAHAGVISGSQSYLAKAQSLDFFAGVHQELERCGGKCAHVSAGIDQSG